MLNDLHMYALNTSTRDGTRWDPGARSHSSPTVPAAKLLIARVRGRAARGGQSRSKDQAVRINATTRKARARSSSRAASSTMGKLARRAFPQLHVARAQRPPLLLHAATAVRLRAGALCRCSRWLRAGWSHPEGADLSASQFPPLARPSRWPSWTEEDRAQRSRQPFRRAVVRAARTSFPSRRARMLHLWLAFCAAPHCCRTG
ncbi:uncharacterized protein B0H18DRAFT_92695 [Fomitopsis serialis]|uniref:uncharacterized protein n=1 Tax=Fomitopsis serialis TaxID=139415 RepID=UPI002007EF00|nr:uncharacterized protein B0H18DRAFT_92695 [Neoantrodia serialis]KAH9915656.1 hypothetical protein B0H18DRAFT_92695 [Neoantrodia serialis]